MSSFESITGTFIIQLTVTGILENEWNTRAEVELNIQASIKQGARPQQVPPGVYSYAVPPATGLSFVISYDMGSDVLLWDEFAPNLYEMRLELQSNDGEKIMSSEQRYTFGMRSFRQVGKHLEVNGRRVFLRGTLECCIFTLTGHPPMEQASWVSLLQTIKDYGLNHIRFHSWCPPQAAFDAACGSIGHICTGRGSDVDGYMEHACRRAPRALSLFATGSEKAAECIREPSVLLYIQ